jgi:hypothetical protein
MNNANPISQSNDTFATHHAIPLTAFGAGNFYSAAQLVYSLAIMKTLLGVGMVVALIGCGGSEAPAPLDAGRDVRQPDAPVASDAKQDTTSPVGDDAGYDLGQADAPVALDTNRYDLPGSPIDAVDGMSVLDAGYDVGQADAPVAPDANQHDLLGGPVDATDVTNAVDGMSVLDGGEQCLCSDGSGPSQVPWSCFCSVESCTRTLADFVSAGDGGKSVNPGEHTVLVLEYASCNLVLVQAKTYSDYVPNSEYVFDRTTGAMVGAKVWLDDREHSCPFASDGGSWIFGYQSGIYPVPSTCQATECLPGSGTCP